MVKTPSDPGLPGSAPTESYWQVPPHALASHQSSRLPTETSVVIIGSRSTGTSIAHHLLNSSPQLDIVMLEARAISSGATGRNGGHCKDVPFKTYKKWKTEFGQEVAAKLVRFRGIHVESTRDLALLLRQEGFVDAQFRDLESVTAVFDSAIFRELKDNMDEWLEDFPKERAWCSTMTGEQANKVVSGNCGSFESAYQLTSCEEVWPGRCVRCLDSPGSGTLAVPSGDRSTRASAAQTSRFLLGSTHPVTSIIASEDASKPYVVSTPRGQIRSRHVIHCMNGHASHLLPAFRGKIVPVRGQMTALTPSLAFPKLGHERSWALYWPNGGFDYMTQSGDVEGHVFLGRGVEQASSAGVVDLNRASDSEINAPAVEHLCRVLPNYLEGGERTKLKQAWTGVMGFTTDNFPVVGKLPRELSPTKVPNGARGCEWIAAGFNGYGMVHCWYSGRAIADMILERSQEQIDEYFPKEQFECSRARLERMDFGGMASTFYKNAPDHIKSRL